MESKDSHDPGWNDPPTFTFDKATAIQTAAANKKGITLNKRVAFPISGNTQNSQGPSLYTADGKPPTKPPQNSLATTSIKSDILNVQVEDKLIGQNLLDDVIKNLEIDMNSNSEIVKRIKIMEKMWLDKKLDKNVCLKIFELSKALANDDADHADYIQKSLMVDNISQCSSWMSGIRHLINQKRPGGS